MLVACKCTWLASRQEQALTVPREVERHAGMLVAAVIRALDLNKDLLQCDLCLAKQEVEQSEHHSVPVSHHRLPRLAS